MASDAERKRFFENALQDAEADYKKNNKDSVALTRWGGALLELANFHPGEEAAAMVDEAVVKFQKALDIDPNKHDTLWCLGNAYTSQGFLSAKRTRALSLFKKAKECFAKALVLQPDNHVYKKGVEMTDKAPELYTQIQVQIAQSQAMQPDVASRTKESTFWWDVLGWVTLAALVTGVSVMINMSAPPLEPPPSNAQQPSASRR